MSSKFHKACLPNTTDLPYSRYITGFPRSRTLDHNKVILSTLYLLSTTGYQYHQSLRQHLADSNTLSGTASITMNQSVLRQMLLCTTPSGKERTPSRALTSHGPTIPCRSADPSTRLRATKLSHTIAVGVVYRHHHARVPRTQQSPAAIAPAAVRAVPRHFCAVSHVHIPPSQCPMQVTFTLSQCAVATELVAYKVSEHAPGMLCSTELCKEKHCVRFF
jgi:hypothetical protein